MSQMTVSELIKALQKIEAKHGEAGVIAVPRPEHEFPSEIIVEEIAFADDGDVILREVM